MPLVVCCLLRSCLFSWLLLSWWVVRVIGCLLLCVGSGCRGNGLVWSVDGAEPLVVVLFSGEFLTYFGKTGLVCPMFRCWGWKVASKGYLSVAADFVTEGAVEILSCV